MIKLIKQDTAEEGEERRDTQTLPSPCEAQDIALLTAAFAQVLSHRSGENNKGKTQQGERSLR